MLSATTIAPSAAGKIFSGGYSFSFNMSLTHHKKNIYLDYAAATPVDLRVQKVMQPFLSQAFGNPSSLHQKGKETSLAIARARQTVAKLVGSKPEEIIFTAGGSESVSLAIFGVARHHQQIKKDQRLHLITSVIEHHCVLNSFSALAGEGLKTSYINVDKTGVVDIKQLKSSVRPETILISIMLANNEIGTVEPVAEIGKWLKGLNIQRAAQGLPKIIFHTDACQAAGFLNLDVNKLGVDLMSVNGGKIYGPKQTGFLYVRSGTELKPIIYGGGQEKGLRGGTENAAGVVGLAKALELVSLERNKENDRLTKLRDYLISRVLKENKGILLNGVDNINLKVNKESLLRLPNNANFTIKGVEGEALMLYLDAYGIFASTSSACSTGSTEASHVLLAIGRNEQEARSSIRMTLGKQTTKDDIDYVLRVLKKLISELRKVKQLS